MYLVVAVLAVEFILSWKWMMKWTKIRLFVFVETTCTSSIIIHLFVKNSQKLISTEQSCDILTIINRRRTKRQPYDVKCALLSYYWKSIFDRKQPCSWLAQFNKRIKSQMSIQRQFVRIGTVNVQVIERYHWNILHSHFDKSLHNWIMNNDKLK